MKTLTNIALPLFAVVAALPAFAGVPDAVTYAGTLNQGSAPANGTFTVVLGLFDAEANGNRVFQQTESSLAVSQGQFAVDLGIDPTNPLSDEVLKGGPLFLDIVVNGEELTPRIPFTSVPFARRASKADDADTVGGLSADEILDVLQGDGGLQRVGDRFQIAPAGVTAIDMAVGSVNSQAIADGTVGSSDLADRSITGAKIADGNVSNAKLSGGSVTTDKIVNGAIVTDRLAAHAVTAAKVDGLAVFVEPSICGSHLVLARPGGLQTKCKTIACDASHFNACDGTCSALAPVTCDVPDSATDEIGLLIAK